MKAQIAIVMLAALTAVAAHAQSGYKTILVPQSLVVLEQRVTGLEKRVQGIAERARRLESRVQALEMRGYLDK